MKTKLTIIVDEEILQRGKRFARSRGISLSQLIERSLREYSSGETRSSSQRWRGTFRPAARTDERCRLLAQKYL